MAEVRRRRRRSDSNNSANGDGVNENTQEIDLTSNAVPSEQARAVRPIKETIEREKSTAMITTLGGILVAVFYLYLGLATEVPMADVAHAVVIDAGSTGTRAQVFSFRDGGLIGTKIVNSSSSVIQLGYGVPAVDFFKPLLDGVNAAVPGTKRRKSVPLALRATAGFRLALPEISEKAIAQAQKYLKSSGYLVKDEWVSILDDQSEGVGAWITVNYLRGHLNGSVSSSSAVMELGGSSLQIVFEASDEAMKAVEKTRKAAVASRIPSSFVPRVVEGKWGGQDRKLISINRLGFGLKDFAKKLYSVFDREGVLTEGNPCFRKGKILQRKTLMVGIEARRLDTFTGDGDFERCVASAEIAMSEYGPLDPELLKLLKGDIVAFAFIYERTVGLGISESATEEELVKLGKMLCEGNGSLADDGDEACLEFSYVYFLLSQASSQFSDDISLRLEQYIDGHMVGWSLGSVLTDFHEELGGQMH